MKKIFISLCSISIILCLNSCRKRLCANVNLAIYAQIKTNNDSDYLAQFSDEVINDSTELYNKDANGNFIKVQSGENPNIIVVSDTPSLKIVRICLIPSSNGTQNISTNVIKFPNGDTDTLEFNTKKTKCHYGYTDLYFNGEPVVFDNQKGTALLKVKH